MIRILTIEGEVITACNELADVERALAENPTGDIELVNRFGYEDPVNARRVVAVWEAGPIDMALGRRRTAKEVVLELVHDHPGIDRLTLGRDESWRAAGWLDTPHPSTVNTALQQLDVAGELLRVDGRFHLTNEGCRRVKIMRRGALAAA